MLLKHNQLVIKNNGKYISYKYIQLTFKNISNMKYHRFFHIYIYILAFRWIIHSVHGFCYWMQFKVNRPFDQIFLAEVKETFIIQWFIC